MTTKHSRNGKPDTLPLVRCAIYTRKSTEEGLEQEFNSLDAQRESGETCIAVTPSSTIDLPVAVLRMRNWRTSSSHTKSVGFSTLGDRRPTAAAAGGDGDSTGG